MLCKANGVFRLTRDAELKYLQNGTAVLKLGLACSEKFKDKETTLFIDGTIFGKPAEIINQWAGAKGTQIHLAGKLQTEQWVDQQQGKRSKISMMIESFEFLGGRDSSNAPVRDATTRGSGYDGNTHQNNNNGSQGGYDARNDTYQQAPQQNSQPHPDYAKQNQQANENQANRQASQMPTPDNIPEIDVDDPNFNGQ